MNRSEGGIGFLGLLTLIFITLKVIGKIDWNWLWVLAPLWIPASVMFAVAVFAVGFVVVKYFLDRRKRAAVKRSLRW